MRYYLVEITWEDNIRNVFIVTAKTGAYAGQIAKEWALNMWTGEIITIKATPLKLPRPSDALVYLYTDHSNLHQESTQ